MPPILKHTPINSKTLHRLKNNTTIMYKKSLAIFLGAALALSSCTEVLSPSVSYGGNSYTNDYTKLIEAVNDLTKTISERFLALNTAIKQGAADITLSIDKNTGAIESQTTSLNNLKVSIFDGFAALNEQLETSGGKLVAAVNSSGDLISAQLDIHNKLIETNVCGKLSEINKTLASGDSTLASRLGVLNTLINSGVVELKASNKNLDNISTNLSTVNKNLSSIDGTLGHVVDDLGSLNDNVVNLTTELKEGFATISTSIDKNGNIVATAISKNGELLEETINNSTEQVKVLATNVAKLDATTLAGFTTIQKAVTALQEQLSKDMGTLTTEEKAKLQGIIDKLQDMIKANQDNTKLITDYLKTISENLGNLNTSVTDTNNGLSAVVNALTNLNNALTGENGAITKLTEQEKKNAENIVAKLESLLNEDGIYYPTDSKGKVYITESKWAEIQKSDDAYNAIMHSLSETVFTVQKCLILDGEVASSATATLTVTPTYTYKLHADNLGIHSQTGTTKMTYEVTKLPATVSLGIKYTHVSVSLSTTIAYATNDANGAQFRNGSIGKYIELNFNKDTQTWVNKVQLLVYATAKESGYTPEYKDEVFTTYAFEDVK